MSDTNKPQFDPRVDAEVLRSFSRQMTFNDTAIEASCKHVLNEIAMRLETGGYQLPVSWPTPTDLQAKIVQQVADVIPVVLAPAVEADAAPEDDHPSELSVAVWEAVQLALGDAYDCSRVWSAWQIGTMHADDFVRVADQPSRVDEIASAVLGLLPPSVTRGHTWADMEDITDEPAVFGALQAFGQDPTDVHGVLVVEAVLKALGLKTSPWKVGVDLASPTPDQHAKITEASMGWKEGMPIPTVRISVEDGKPAFTHLDGEPLRLTADELKVCEEAGKSVKPLEPWQHHAKKLVEWRNCMSYNDSYFGEPAGLLKQVVAELERLMPPHPVKAAEAKEGGAA